MNKAILFAIPLILRAGAATAQVPSPASAAPAHTTSDDSKAARFEFIGGDTHDFGEVEDGPEISYTFKYKNVGKQPLIVTSASTSGGGDVAYWSREPVLPGKTGEIKVSFNTSGKAGQPFHKTTFIISNAASKEWATHLFIKGRIVAKKTAPQVSVNDQPVRYQSYLPTHPSLDDPKAPRFKFLNGESHDFGTVEDGPDLEYRFKFKNIGKEPLIIINVNTSDGATVAYWDKAPVLPGKTGDIKVIFCTAGRGESHFDRTIYILSNAASEKEQYELRIKGKTVPGRRTSVPVNASLMRGKQ